jgi:hypothetical protein
MMLINVREATMRYAIVRCAVFVSCSISFAIAAETAVPEKPSPEQIKTWRKEGPAAVDHLVREREKLMTLAAAKKLADDHEAERAVGDRLDAINETIDRVAAARYSHESGLYWYTDENEAYRVAKEQGKPVLALRLLGNLDEELSCANSRYFRILLYPDDKVRQLLHDKFILTWKSVRPVPKITIDLGDGRKVERTITGNSVHYVVLPDGKVVDVFPGLYGPLPFVERLVKAEAAAQRALRGKDPKAELSNYQQQQIADLAKAWMTDVAKYRAHLRTLIAAEATPEQIGIVPPPVPSFWEVAATFHPEYSELSKASQALVRQEAKAGEKRGRETLRPTNNLRPTNDLDYAFSKGGDERALHTLLACIQPTLQADTIYNEYRGRYAALRHLTHVPMAGLSPFDDDYRSFSKDLIPTPSPRPAPTPLEALNDFVYSQIFHYDANDPWIGLARLDSLTALPKDRGLKPAARKE